MSGSSDASTAGVHSTAATLVLVVDDSPVDRRFAGGMVERLPGLRAVYAANGVEALDLMAKEPPAAVLTDLQMPEMDGLELVETIRNRFPRIPVILMTAYGSEDIAIQALRSGASSYVPKKSLARELGETLEQVLAAARINEQRQHLLGCLRKRDSQFSLGNDPALVPPFIAMLQEDLVGMKLCDETGLIRVGVALEEAILNALYHGNLEVSSDLRQVNDRPFIELAQQRRQQSPYRERRIYVQAQLDSERACYVVRDEGPGFDPSKLPDPTDPANLGQSSGRGVLLIRTFMDEVTYNATGNEITMIKNRESSKRSGTR